MIKPYKNWTIGTELLGEKILNYSQIKGENSVIYTNNFIKKHKTCLRQGNWNNKT